MSRRRWLAPEVIQTSEMDCGPASLKCLLDGFGIPVSYGRLREACQTDVDGTSIDTLEEVANRLGLEASQTMLPLDCLFLNSARALPALILIRQPSGLTHFVVVWRRHGSLLQVMDPAMGRRWVRLARFAETIYRHGQAVPAEAWREWAGSEESLVLLRERMAALGLNSTRMEERIAAALRDPEWKSLASLDAATRLTTTLVGSGALTRGRAARALAAFESHPDQIPDDSWAVVAADGVGEVSFRGAVFLKVERRRAERVSLDQLSPELAAALREPPARPLRTLLSLTAEQGWLAPGALLAAIGLAGAGTLLEGLLFRGLFDVARDLELAGQRAAAFASVLGFLVLLLLVEIPQVSGLLRLGRQLETRLRLRFLEKIPRLADRYFQSRPKSDMAERSHSLHRIRHLPEFAGRTLRGVCEALFTALGIVWLDPQTWPLVTGYLAFAIGVPLVARPTLNERDLRLRTHQGALSRFYLDALLGLFAIRAHGAARRVRHAHKELLTDWANAALNLQKTVARLEGLQMLAGYVFAGAVILDHLRRHSESGSVLLLLYWALNLPSLAQILVQAAWQYPAYRNVTLRLLEPLGAIEEPRAAPVASSEPAPGTAQGMSVELEKVSVVVAGHTILEEITARIPAGSHVAIVGRSGAGKSSLVGLFLGWHRAAAGSIRIDGAELPPGSAPELREQIAWVDPEVHLWNTTCLDNLGYGAPAASAADTGVVVEHAALSEVLRKLPEGLQTALGEGGGRLSGGEGQRVRFARGLMRRNARLVILDEPFRGLDRDLRQTLMARARERWGQATLLAITHDVESALAFPRVLVIEDGHIVEDDVPSVLAAREGSRFAALLEAQHAAHGGIWEAPDWRRVHLTGGVVLESQGAGT